MFHFARMEKLCMQMWDLISEAKANRICKSFRFILQTGLLVAHFDIINKALH